MSDGKSTARHGDRGEDASGNQREPALARRQENVQPQALVSPLKSMELQVGEHVVRALQIEHTVAVLTTVLAAPDGTQSIISMPLNESQLNHVQQMMSETAPASETGRVPCVGFHCYLPLPKRDEGDTT